MRNFVVTIVFVVIPGIALLNVVHHQQLGLKPECDPIQRHIPSIIPGGVKCAE